MALDSSAIRKLAALGLTPEQFAGVLDVFADKLSAEEERKRKDRERKARARGQSTDNPRTVHGQSMETPRNVRAEPSSLSPPSFSPIPPITTPSDPSSGEITAREPAKRDGARSVLIAGGVEPENADALIELRKRKRAPLSPVMAEKLLKKMAKCRDGPNAAAEEMLAHGWQGFDASWLENRNGNGTSNSGNGRGHAAGKVDDLRDAIAIAKDIDDRRRESLLGDRQEPGGRAIGPR